MISDALAQHIMAGMGVASSSNSGELQQRRLIRQFEADYLQLDEGRLLQPDTRHETRESVSPAPSTLAPPSESPTAASTEIASAVAEVAQVIGRSTSRPRAPAANAALPSRSAMQTEVPAAYDNRYRHTPIAGKNSQPAWIDSLARHHFQLLDKSNLQVIEKAGQLHVYLRNYHLQGEQRNEVSQWIESLLNDHSQHIKRVVFNGHCYTKNGATLVIERNSLL